MQRQSNDFTRILQSANELARAIMADPAWLLAFDENRNTLLHHVVYASTKNDESYVVDIREVLRCASCLHFMGQDKNKNTPLHIAAWHGGIDNTSSLLFPFFIEKAAKSNFDFSTLGEMGLTVLQVAAKVRDKLATNENNNVKTILANTSDAAVNAYSYEGATALYYAVASANFFEAHTLLKHGANPLLYADPRFDVITLINMQIQSVSSRITQRNELASVANGMTQGSEDLPSLLSSYQKLWRSILQNPFVTDYAEIRKNARILFQGKQQIGALFAMPDEMLIKIAAHTANSEVYTEQTATEIGVTYFKRPLT